MLGHVLWGNRQWSLHCRHQNSLLRLGKAACIVDLDLVACNAAMSCPSRQKKKVLANPPSSSLATVQAVHSAPSPTCLFWATISLVVHIAFSLAIWFKGLNSPDFSHKFPFFPIWMMKKLVTSARIRSFIPQTSKLIQTHYLHGLGQLHSKRSWDIRWWFLHEHITNCWLGVQKNSMLSACFFFFFHHHHNKLLSPCARHFDLTVKICIGSRLWRGSSYVYYIHFHGPG